MNFINLTYLSIPGEEFHCRPHISSYLAVSASLFVPGLVHGTGNMRALFGIRALVNGLVHQRAAEQLFVGCHGFQSRQWT